ncbi:hypothetical protein [Fuchsiella alkaliacetigena]|uniref:hypothetical protein n=1 Tax=Fuchsiella alkaliacetigena TaxID=957042 RepID=UPI00200A7D3E|nr:hypothetical protein [Fuchsiella alkaliacetigena]MCK8824689.1 hypothetical protein [Fuchsiella alkaliacetigena]
MSRKHIEVQIPLDDYGLVRQKCSYCSQEFKLFPEDLEAITTQRMYCPICGLHSDVNEFLTEEQLGKMMDIAQNHAINLVNNSLKKLDKSLKSSPNVEFESKPLSKKEVRVLIEKSDFEKAVLSCLECSEYSIFLFVPATMSVVYCLKCGDMLFFE